MHCEYGSEESSWKNYNDDDDDAVDILPSTLCGIISQSISSAVVNKWIVEDINFVLSE